MEIRKDYGRLSGMERVSLLMLSLGEDQVQKIFRMLEDEEIKEIAKSMASLGKVSSNIVEIMVSEFMEQLTSTGSLVGSIDSTRRLLSKALDKDKVEGLLEEISGPAGRTMWDKLSNVNEELLANYLKNEYPQTIAVILSRIKPEHSSRVLTLLPENLVIEVIMRMLRIESVRKEVIDEIEKTLRVEFTNNISKTSKRDSFEQMADIFNCMDRQTETRFLSTLEERDFQAAERIRSLMFTFEDIAKLDPRDIQAVIRVADKTKIALALKGASDVIKNLFFKGMSERAAKIMREDMIAMGMVRVRDVEEAQNYIVLTAKELANKGDININTGRGGDDEKFIG